MRQCQAFLTCVGLSTMRASGTVVRRSQSSSGAALPSDEPPDNSSIHAGWSAQVQFAARQALCQQYDGSEWCCGDVLLTASPAVRGEGTDKRSDASHLSIAGSRACHASAVQRSGTLQEAPPVLAHQAEAQPVSCGAAMGVQAAEGDGAQQVPREVRRGHRGHTYGQRRDSIGFGLVPTVRRA